MRKAVSPLVATVLLIAFTMAIAAVLTAWISTFTATTQEQARASEEKIRCTYASIDIDSDYVKLDKAWDGTTTVISTRIRNKGLSDIQITSYSVAYKGRVTPARWVLTNPITIARTPENNSFIGAFNLSIDGVPLTFANMATKIVFNTICDAVWATMEEPLIGSWPEANLTDRFPTLVSAFPVT